MTITQAADVELVTRSSLRLNADPTRVMPRLFVPGQQLLLEGESRAASVMRRVMALSDDEADLLVAQTLISFAPRHRRFNETLVENYREVAHLLGADGELPPIRQMLIGAYFTHEYAVESAALFNPSMVAHPDQSGLSAGQTRFVMSLRAVGEGHISSVEFRTGIVDADCSIQLDELGPHLVSGRRVPTVFDARLFHSKLAELDDDGESAAFILDSLPEKFTKIELEAAMARLRKQRRTHTKAGDTLQHLDWIASCNYDVAFPEDTLLSERVLWPSSPAEDHGIEDARFVRFVDDDQTVTYYATYTAFHGVHVTPHLLQTQDFRTFRMTQMCGAAAHDKGMALFPRKIGGRYFALSRGDRESTSVATSDDARCWEDPMVLETPEHPWELIQVGNCGSPIETSAGWLVLTHGVGPMRTYALGAMLLDLADPSHVLARLSSPLMVPTPGEREGYVPNVLYSCGAMLHGDALVMPYGISDSAVSVARLDLQALLGRLGASS